MIEFGCLTRYFNDYRDEVQSAKDNCFSFMQIWYDKKGLNLKSIEELFPVILDEGFPAIIHAVLDINEIPDHITILKELLTKHGHKQLIIHPICKSELFQFLFLEENYAGIAVQKEQHGVLSVLTPDKHPLLHATDCCVTLF